MAHRHFVRRQLDEAEGWDREHLDCKALQQHRSRRYPPSIVLFSVEYELSLFHDEAS